MSMIPAHSCLTDPDAPAPAAIDRSLRHPVMFFLTSGAAWLAAALVLGVLASMKVHNPDFLAHCAWLTYGRVFPAHLNALVYGWGMQAAFAVILWLMAGHSHKACTTVAAVLTAGHVWNLAVALGIAGILSGHGTGMPWMEFPAFAWPVLLVCYGVIVVGPFIQFRVRPQGPVAIAQWYVLAAMIWFPWVFITAHMLLHRLPGHPVMAAGINAWYKSALIYLFFTPVAMGAVYHIATRVSGRPVWSDALARLGFWSLAIIAPWAGMQRLAGVPLPYFLPYFGAAATALLFIPGCAAAVNTLRTMGCCRVTFAAGPVPRFTAAGIAALVLLTVAAPLLNLPDSTLPLTQFSLSGYGIESLAIYGFFSLVMFGACYFIVPQVTGRDWCSRRLVQMHFLFSVYGLITLVLVTLIGGVQQGLNQEDWRQPWMGAASSAIPYAVANTFAWCLILFANAFFFLHLILMWLRPGCWRLQALLTNHPPPTPTHSADGALPPASHAGRRAAPPHCNTSAGSSPMSLRFFILALAISFGAAWLAVVVIPFFKMRDLAPVTLSLAKDGASGVFFPKRAGRVADGAAVYAANGCALCHTQVVRPTYAGNDLYRPDWGGLKSDPERGDTRRETNAYDFLGEKFSQIGAMRMGPDLSNLGRRVESIHAAGGDPAAWLYAHLYNPRLNPQLWQSTCPPHPFLFEKHAIKGNPSADALKAGAGDHHEWLPGSEAKALVSYLLSLKKDQPTPAALNFAPGPHERAH